ncbi:hypothetical protein [Anaerococcus sp. Marseille-Q5996]|uniref:hypothetical protein n=1 Tax=Anaerococcus sp. Marseille-Q5996 TaxID=2972769 RepID=UPI0021C6523A|nr:hypothetical protein [Anaerococcus sp. Marseille-Q5996]
MMDDGQYLKRTNPDGNTKADKEKSTKKQMELLLQSLHLIDLYGAQAGVLEHPGIIKDLERVIEFWYKTFKSLKTPKSWLYLKK